MWIIAPEFDEYVRINKANKNYCTFVENFDISRSDPKTRRANLKTLILTGDIRIIPTLQSLDTIIADNCNINSCGDFPSCTNASFVNNNLTTLPYCPQIKRLVLSNNNISGHINIYNYYPLIEELDLSNNCITKTIYPTASTVEFIDIETHRNNIIEITNPSSTLTILQVQNNINLDSFKVPDVEGITDINHVSGRNILILDISHTKLSTVENLSSLHTLITDYNLIKNFVNCTRPTIVSCLPENTNDTLCHELYNFLLVGGNTPKIKHLRAAPSAENFADENPHIFTRKSKIITDDWLTPSKHLLPYDNRQVRNNIDTYLSNYINNL